MCIDYRSLNEDTGRDVYPLPLIEEIFDKLGEAKVFSKMDLRSGYHQQLVRPEDTYKTAFRTPLGSFEFLVLPFGMTNAPSAFVRMINKVFPSQDFGKFMVPYLDDLLVFSKTKEEHLAHLRIVLEHLKEAKLYAKASKCTFAADEAKYLGFLVSGQGIRSDPAVTERGARCCVEGREERGERQRFLRRQRERKHRQGKQEDRKQKHTWTL